MSEPNDNAPVPPAPAAPLFTFDSEGRLVRCVHPDGTTTTYTWDDPLGEAPDA